MKNIDKLFCILLRTSNAAKAKLLELDEITTPTPTANIGKVYTKSDNRLYFQDGAGSEHELACCRYYAEAYKYNAADKTIIDTADTFHSLQNLVEGLSLGFTWVAGTRNTDITTMATYDGGASTLITTTAAHNLNVGDYITITGTTNYNSSYEVLSVPTTTTFEIDKAWDGNNDATGTYSRGDSYICDSGAGGIYGFEWNVTGKPDAINKAYNAAILINKAGCEKCVGSEYFTKAEYETVSGGALFDISDGDHVCIVIQNLTDTTDITFKHANFRIERIR